MLRMLAGTGQLLIHPAWQLSGRGQRAAHASTLRLLRNPPRSRQQLHLSSLNTVTAKMFSSAVDKHAQQGVRNLSSLAKSSDPATVVRAGSRPSSSSAHASYPSLMTPPTSIFSSKMNSLASNADMHNARRSLKPSNGGNISKLTTLNTDGFEDMSSSSLTEKAGPSGSITTRTACPEQSNIYFEENDFDDDIDFNAITTGVSGVSASMYPKLDTHALFSRPRTPERTRAHDFDHLQHQLKAQSSEGDDVRNRHLKAHATKPQSTSRTTVNTHNSTVSYPVIDLSEQSEDPPAKRMRRKLPWSPRKPARQSTQEDHPAASSQSYRTPNSKVDGPQHLWNQTASAIKLEQERLKHKQSRGSKSKNGPSADNALVKLGRKEKITPRICLSQEQKRVLAMVMGEGKASGQSVFFTGSAGTGKSVLLRRIIQDLKKKYRGDTEAVAVTASTGLAACNIGGITLHSFSGIGLGREDVPTLVKRITRSPKSKQRWLKAKVLVMDEVSMVDGDLFDKLENIARVIRRNERPFGGLQLVITGDFFQLPPVPDNQQPQKVKFAFQAESWSKAIDHTIGLTQVFRQRDPVFANLLNEMRLGKISTECIKTFKSLERSIDYDDGLGATELFSLRTEVENANNARLARLTGEERVFMSTDAGSMEPERRDKFLANCMAPSAIKLKKGAQVMLIKNLDENLVNGSLGMVVGFSDVETFELYRSNEDQFSSNPDDKEMNAELKAAMQAAHNRAKQTNSNTYPHVRFTLGDGSIRSILCEPETWKSELPNGEIAAARTQVPLILAWALSIHKAQGQTLERVKVNLGRVFEKGQAYVALSRATTKDGLQVLGFDAKRVMAHEEVRKFYDSLYKVGDIPQKTTVAGAVPTEYTGGLLGEEDDDEYELRAMHG